VATPTLIRAVEREALVFRKLWRGDVFTSFVGPLLFLSAMGLGLGRYVDDGTGAAQLDGLDYLVFVTPGLLIASVMQSAAADSLWPVMGGLKWFGSFHAMVSTPLAPGDVFGGKVIWTGVRAGISAVAFMIVAVAIGGIESWWAVLAIPVAVLTALAFAAPLAAYAGACESDQSFSIIMRLGIVPLFLFSGTFFPVSQLPDAVQPLAWLSPLWHGVEPARSFTTGAIDWPITAVHLAILIAIAAAGWRWGVARFTRRLTP
jgi:lipooligosaccharide transport system permease protein